MNDIRKNEETEVVIVRAKFDMPIGWKIFNIIATVLFMIVAGMYLYSSIKYGWSITTPKVFFLLFLGAMVALGVGDMQALKKSECIVTNKSIKGVIVGLFLKKHYNYRLDEIENVEMVSSLGVNALVLHFSQGKVGGGAAITYGQKQQTMAGANVFTLKYIVNRQEVFEKLSGLLESVKNEIDVAVDIQMKKIEVEERKAKAFETLATGEGTATRPSANDDLEKLEKLALMKEKGLITEAEYETKKEELLSRI